MNYLNSMDETSHRKNGVKTRPISTFLGAPIGDLEDLSPGMIAIAGIYCDHFGEGVPGARFAARQIRYSSWQGLYQEPITISTNGLIDIGDLNVFPLEPQRHEKILSEQSEKIFRKGARLLSVGGDYTVSPAILKGALSAMPDNSIGIIRISRRLDLFHIEPFKSLTPSRQRTTSRISELINGGLNNVVLIGAEGSLTVEEIEQSSEALVIPAFHLIDNMVTALKKIREACQNCCDNYYLSIDADVLNACYDSTTFAGNNLGLTKEQLSVLLDGLHGIPVLAADVTGFIPDFDVTGRTNTAIIENIVRGVIGILRHKEVQCF